MQVGHDRAATVLAAGDPVVLIAGRTGGLLMAAAVVHATAMASAVRHGSGLIRVAMGDEKANRLHLPRMWPANSDGRPPASFAVCVDAAEGITTGISARDRSATARLLADPHTLPGQLRRPGHVIPVRVGGRQDGYAWACLRALDELGFDPVGVFTDVVDEVGQLAGPAALHQFALEHGLPLVVRPDSASPNTAALLRGIHRLSEDPAIL